MAAAATRAPRGGEQASAAALRAYLEHGDPRAREQLIEQYVPLVIAIARRYERSGEPLEDLVQVGVIGLIQAVDRFDPARGVGLPAFAIPTIAGEIQRHLRDLGSTIRVPRRVQEARSRALRARDELESRLGRPASAEELARATGLRPEEAADALAASSARAPLPLADELTASGAEGGAGERDGGLSASEQRVLLAEGFSALDARERRVLHLRFYAGLSQAEIAAQTGISQAHVSRLIRGALATLRAELSDAPEPADSAVSADEQPVPPPPAPPVPARSRVRASERDQRLSRPQARRSIQPVAIPETTRSLDQYLELPYHLELVRDEGAVAAEAWVARVDELDGCVARAASADAAAVQLRAAMEAWIATALARGQAVPLPRTPATHSGRLLLRMPPSLHADLARMAEREDVSLNQLIMGVLSSAAAWRGSAATTSADGGAASPAGPPRTWRLALILNVAVVAVAGIVAVVLLVLALQS